MATPGMTLDTLVREVWTPELFQTYWRNSWIFNSGVFTEQQALPGSKINTGYQYSTSTNAGTYQYDDAMVEPGNSLQVLAEFNKDHYQNAARIFMAKVYESASVYETGRIDQARKALEDATIDLLDVMTTTMIADIEAQVDAANTYSDTALVRATYGMTSYEEDTSTALTLAHLEDAVEALLTRTTYGTQVRSKDNLVWLAPQNQITNLSRLSTGASNFSFDASSQNMANIDAGRVMRTASFEGIPIVSVPDMTSTTILLLHKPDCKLWRTRPLETVAKTEKADTDLWGLFASYNAIVHNPVNSAKLSNKTA